MLRNLTGTTQQVRLRGTYGTAALDFGPASIAPGAEWTGIARATIRRPRLWSTDRPTLYRANLTLYDSAHRQLGGYFTYSGIRSITVSRDGQLLLNGRRLNLRGVEVREQDAQSGTALSSASLQQLIAWVRQLGASLIRADPLDPQVEELADRYGILIWSDITVNQHTTVAHLQDPHWLAYARGLLRDDIIANQNHPSVLVWSIGNELPTPVPKSEASYISSATAYAHRLDPTRPVGMAVQAWPGLSCQAAYAPLDVIGLNEYFGWFDAGGGTTDDRDAVSPFLDTFRACYPRQAAFVTEFGFDANRDGPVEERGTYQFQSDAAAFHLGVFASKPWLSGAIYFILQDAATFPNYSGGNPWPAAPINQKGLIDFQGHFKPAFAVVQAIYGSTVQIARSVR